MLFVYRRALTVSKKNIEEVYHHFVMKNWKIFMFKRDFLILKKGR